MKQLLLLPILLIAFTAQIRAAKAESPEQLREKEVLRLRTTVEETRDSLQREIADRYTFKQRAVAQRETDKEEFDRLREAQERVLNDLARVKEEALAKEQERTDALALTKGKREEWNAVKDALTELLRRDADALPETFPADAEPRRLDLETIRAQLLANGRPTSVWPRYLALRLRYFKLAQSPSLMNCRLLPASGAPRQMTIARFGNVFAYAIDSAGSSFIIRQTGKSGAERYAIDEVAAPQLRAWIQTTLPHWSTQGVIAGETVTEVLQNDQSTMLIEGRKISFWETTYRQLKAGGSVMIPLLLLPLWVLVLGIIKSWQLFGRRARFRRDFALAMRHIENATWDEGVAVLNHSHGLIAEAALLCIQHRDQPPTKAENLVSDRIMEEIPVLNRGLNTLAVIAGAAPLLGLLGTISGMIALFAAVTHYGTGDPKFLAGGISEALITAKTGLAIAIPTLFLHDFLRNTRDSLIADIERMCSRLLTKMAMRR